MIYERSPARILFYLLISVVLPLAGVFINHFFWTGNILVSIILMGWMGFALLALQPYTIDEYETIEP